jgi:hypothetical protein
VIHPAPSLSHDMVHKDQTIWLIKAVLNQRNHLIRFRFSFGFIIVNIQLCVWDWLLIRFNIWFSLGFFMKGFHIRMHSVKLRFLWMMGSTQFFWWVIQRDEDRLWMGCFWATKKAYLECILGLVLSLVMNIGLGHMGSKVGLS